LLQPSNLPDDITRRKHVHFFHRLGDLQALLTYGTPGTFGR
jgi:hypothetical protein